MRAGQVRGIHFGSGFELGGRRLFLSNPFMPFWPDFRVEWDNEQVAPVSAASDVAGVFPQHLLRAAAGPLVGLSGLSVRIIAPVALLFWILDCFPGSSGSGVARDDRRACAGVLASDRAGAQAQGQAASIILVAIVCLPCGPESRASRDRVVGCGACQRRVSPQLGFTAANAGVVQGQVREALVTCPALRGRRRAKSGR